MKLRDSREELIRLVATSVDRIKGSMIYDSYKPLIFGVVGEFVDIMIREAPEYEMEPYHLNEMALSLANITGSLFGMIMKTRLTPEEQKEVEDAAMAVVKEKLREARLRADAQAETYRPLYGTIKDPQDLN